MAKYTENATCHFATTVQGVCGGSQCSASVVFAHPSRQHPLVMDIWVASAEELL